MLALYVVAVLLIVAAMMGLSFLLGERHRQAATVEPYESGIRSTGTAGLRFPAHFYLIAVLFVIFDLEAVFLFAWAAVAREAGWTAYFEILVFVGVLLAAWIYLWRVGALDWRRVGRLRAPGRLDATGGSW